MQLIKIFHRQLDSGLELDKLFDAIFEYASIGFRAGVPAAYWKYYTSTANGARGKAAIRLIYPGLQRSSGPIVSISSVVLPSVVLPELKTYSPTMLSAGRNIKLYTWIIIVPIS